ncbi:MAG: ArV1 [Thermoleophilia bacterium]|nr:ArV1 [Thermoleophilia bacterium]
MKPVDQTAFHPGADAPEEQVGNCWSACIASILEVPIAEVPTFVAHDDWWERAQAWLRERGFGIYPLPPQVLDAMGIGPQALDCWYIACGRSPRGEHQHAVVASGQRVAHDPNPERTGLVGPIIDLCVIYRLDAEPAPAWELAPQVELHRTVTVA